MIKVQSGCRRTRKYTRFSKYNLPSALVGKTAKLLGLHFTFPYIGAYPTGEHRQFPSLLFAGLAPSICAIPSQNVFSLICQFKVDLEADELLTVSIGCEAVGGVYALVGVLEAVAGLSELGKYGKSVKSLGGVIFSGFQGPILYCLINAVKAPPSAAITSPIICRMVIVCSGEPVILR